MFKLFARYSSVGVLNTLIHWLVFSVLYLQHLTQSLANLLAFCVAVTFSFFVNARWTFNARVTGSRYLCYVIFMGALATLVGYLADQVMLNPLLTLMIFSAISLVAGFIWSKLFVFRERR